MKTISNNTAVRLTTWDATRRSQMAMIHDMGLDKDLVEWGRVDDTNCLYGAARTIFLSSDPQAYELDDAKYANPVILEDGELVRLDRNGKTYRVKCMGRNGKFEYYSDLLHFELVNA